MRWAPLLALAACGEPCPSITTLTVLPMTEARARALAPEITTGFAATVAWRRGDCRPRPPAAPGGCGDLGCVTEPAPLVVLLVPIGAALALDEGCAGGIARSAWVAAGAVELVASPAGELVAAVPPGRYELALSADGRCGRGLGTFGVLRVEEGRVALRDLVLDDALHGAS